MKTDISAVCQCCFQSISLKCLSSFYLDWVSGRNSRRIEGIGGWDCGLISNLVLGMVVGGGGRSTNRYKSSVAQMFIEITYVAFAFWEIWRLGDQEDRF